MARKAKYKVGDRVTVPHIGDGEVRKIGVFDGVFNYVLQIGSELYLAAEDEIQTVLPARGSEK